MMKNIKSCGLPGKKLKLKSLAILSVLALINLLITSCGGKNENDSTATRIINTQESQRYFPLTDGNVWVSRITNVVDGSTTASYTSVSQRTGTRLIGNAITLVMSNTDLPSLSMSENYLVRDNSGLMIYGSNNPADAIYTALLPYRLLSFPIQVGARFQQVNKTGLDYGRDLDGDGKNESIDISATAFVRGFETVTTAVGTFQNCLRIDTNVTETLTSSSNGATITVTGIETDWYAQDIGPVKQTIAYSGNGKNSVMTEELTGYMVDGHSAGLSLRSSSTQTSINTGATAQVSATLYSENTALMSIPAAWVSDNTTIATVDSSGLVTGNKSGNVTLTPMVGGVAGQPTTVTVLIDFSRVVNYPAPTVIPSSYFYCGDSALGDLNGDGRNDIAVLESSGSRVLVYYQKTNGSLDTPQVITTPLSVSGIAIRDINNDGYADLIISGSSKTATSGWLGRVMIYRQNPVTHVLDPPLEYVLSTNTAGTLAIADLNNDGLPDIIVASANSSGNGILSFLFQEAGGTLKAETRYTSVPVMPGGEVHAADMNSDGLNDIVVQSGNKQLAVIKQTSPGVYSTFPDYYTIQTSYWPYFNSFALGDLNGDGRADIVVADPGNSGKINIFLQNSSGGIDGPTLVDGAYLGQGEVKIADIDGDGLNDIIVYSGGYVVDIYLQSSNHTFMNYQNFFLPTQSEGGTNIHQAMVIGDVTGDGLPDIVTSWLDEGVYVLSRR